MKQILFSDRLAAHCNFYPFTLMRRVADLRIGISTIREKWEDCLRTISADLEELTSDALQNDREYLLVAPNILPSADLLKSIRKLKPGVALISEEGNIIAQCLTKQDINAKGWTAAPSQQQVFPNALQLQFPWHIFQLNKAAMLLDFKPVTRGRKSQTVHRSNRVSGRHGIFVEKGAVIKHCIINTQEGPVYIGKNALVMEGCCIRGPVSIGERAVLKMGAKIYGATTIGPGCMAGGEIKNAVMFDHSNKAHDGYLGDSVIGAWCNLGAGTSNSNLKNTAGNIDVHLQNQKFAAGIKCGVLMGDFSRTAINTSINTGTVIGVSCNVFGKGLTPKNLTSFSWGFDGNERYQLDKAITDAAQWKKLKNQELTDAEKDRLKLIYKQTK